MYPQTLPPSAPSFKATCSCFVTCQFDLEVGQLIDSSHDRGIAQFPENTRALGITIFPQEP